MEFHQEPQVEFVVEQIQTDLADVRKDLDELTHFIKGNGDPTKGLLWLAADLSRLTATMSAAFAAHTADGHGGERRNGTWTRIAFTAATQALGLVITAILFLLALGLVTYIQSGRHP